MNKEIITLNEKLEVKGEYDIIVAGGGVAGVAAALAARRAEKNVLLIEKSIKLGGLATSGLINLFVPMCDGRGNQIIYGMAEEFLRLAIKYGYDTIFDEWKNERNSETDRAEKRYMTFFSAEIFALCLTELMHDSGVDMLFDTRISRPVMTGNHCCGLVVDNVEGRSFYKAKFVVDTTGDIGVMHAAGAPTVDGYNYVMFAGHKIDLNGCKRALKSGKINDAMSGVFGYSADLYGNNQPKDIPLYAGTTAKDICEYTVLNHIKMLNSIKEQDRFSRLIVSLPQMPQFREVRHLDADYTLTTDDLNSHFDDSVAAINDFDNEGVLYEIPFRCLIKSGFDNLITAGRTAAAEGYAWSVLRVIPPAILTGQAAGTAAAMAIENDVDIKDINITELQSKLENQNVIIHFDDKLALSEEERRKRDELKGVHF